MTRYMLTRLAKAVALRVRAASWVEVAKAVDGRPELCHRWPDRYPAVWRALMNEAQRMVWEETDAEARWVLSRMAQSGDPKERAQAEKLLRKYGDRKRK